ncbi:hypothetical protein BC834DRAFT_860719 [Gloeopeniophorella convolvens]|nr:hypothetical protein BC834DRAFT_860719 [Gloeopeniophorella convolvens]
MLVPPTSSALPAALDPAKLSKPRQFSRSTAPPKVVDNTLWTETPAERQQRLADEVMGKKRRAENAEPDADATADAQKRRRRDAELARHVDEYTVRAFRLQLTLALTVGQRKHRGTTLLDKHAQEDAKKDGAGGDEAAGIWDHARDMALGGRLMDDKDRRRIIQDAKGLSDRFGAGTSGGFL